MNSIRDIIFRRRRKKRKKTETGHGPEFILYQNPKSSSAEAYRMLRTNIQYSGDGRDLTSILVTSSGPREGKTTTVLNLGCTFAQANKKTLIIDTDLRNTSFHRLFNLSNDSGFSSVVLGQKRLDEAVHKDVLMPKLDVLTSGPKITNPAEVIGSKDVVDFTNEAKAAYDMVIFDSPPTLAVTDAKLLSFNVDGVILVIQSGKMDKEVAKRAKESLKEVNANIIGVVLNDLDKTKQGYYYYYRHYYAYYERDKQPPEAVLREGPKGLIEKRPPAEEKIPQKPEVAQKEERPKKRDLFIPDSFNKNKDNKETNNKDTGNKPPAIKSDSIIDMLSKEEKKNSDQTKPSNKRETNKNSKLGRKTMFSEDTDKPASKEKKPGKQNEGKSGLGKKDIFKDL